jgi:PmbA protein
MNKPSKRASRALGASATAPAAATSSVPERGFSYSRPFFEDLVGRALTHAKKLGATDASAEAAEGCGLSVSVR